MLYPAKKDQWQQMSETNTQVATTGEENRRQEENAEGSSGPLHVVEQDPTTGDHQPGSRTLAPEDREHLRASGLNDATIEALGFWTCTNEEGRELLGWSEAMPGDASGMVIPYPDQPSYSKVRPHKPRLKPGTKVTTDRDEHGDAIRERGEYVKYEAPVGMGNRCFIPDSICPAIRNPAHFLYITEGEKKAALMAQEGEPCVSVPGVSAAHDAEHRREAQDWGGEEWTLHFQLLPLVTEGRNVGIVFDSPDMTENINVIRGAVRLARMIRERGARPFVGYVPMREGMTKGGLDDFFVAERRRLLNLPGDHLGPFAYDFAYTRPVAPNEQMDWLAEQAKENQTSVSREEQKQAATWACVWYEGKPKDFTGWVRRAAKRFRCDEDELRGFVAHLDRGNADKPPSKWRAFNDKKILEHCIPVLDASFSLLRSSDGTERVFSVNDRMEATLLLEEAPLKKLLHDHLKAEFGEVPPDKLLHRSIVLWKKETLALATEPQPFCFKGDERLCFKRFDWEPTEGPFPAWDEFLGRLSDRDAFMAFVWSCFEPKNRSRQYVWLRGEGQDGKSVVLGVIQNVFGAAATGISNTHLSRANQFVLSSLYGKRVAVYGDCKNARFGMTEIVRNLTSGDHVLIEYKNQTPFNHALYVKLFVASNPKPEISSQNSDGSRMLYIEVAESSTKDDPTWRDRLAVELPGFLWACRKVYGTLCPHHGDIRIGDGSKTLREDAAAAFEERFHNIFEADFRADPAASTPAIQVGKRLDEHRLTHHEAGDFKQWMEREHGIKRKRSSAGRVYVGLALVTCAESVDRLLGK